MSVQLMRVRGIVVEAHWSLLGIVLLVILSISQQEPHLAGGVSGGGPALVVGLITGIGLVLSIALHELAHALVAQRVGIEVPRITLFLLGGVARIASRPLRAGHEFAITAAGPLTSLVLGVALVVAGVLAGSSTPTSPVEVVARGALVLGEVNIGLAIFNCLPGTPLDGGRMLHSLVWRATGSEYRATVWASRGGRLIGFAFVAVGVAMVLGLDVPGFGSGVGGLWLVLIGWFVGGVAAAELRSFRLDVAAGDSVIGELVHPAPVVAPDTSLEEFAGASLRSEHTHAAIVRNGGQPLGIATLHDALRIPANERASTAVGAAMTPWSRVQVIDRDATIADAAAAFAAYRVHQLPVMERERIVGFVVREDVEAWLQLHDPEGR
jgi:Zn-dependent protease